MLIVSNQKQGFPSAHNIEELSFGGASFNPTTQLEQFVGEVNFSLADWFVSISRGMLELTAPNGKREVVRVAALSSGDCQEFASWYDAKPELQPTYSDDMSWKQWWLDLMRGKYPEMSAYKVTAANSEILGVLALKHVIDWYDNQSTTYVNGLRVNPKYIQGSIAQDRYHGVGNALITYAICTSLKNGTEGIGVNSSLGVEGFYRNLGFEERKAFDGERTYFTIKGIRRLYYLIREFTKSSAEASY